MHIIKNKLFTIFLLAIIGLKGYSQTPKINEYSCANVSGTGLYQDAFGGTPDWFEIYNPRTTSLDLNGYFVSNDPTFVGKWQFPINTIIPPKKCLLVYASGRDTVIYGTPNQYHTNFDLLQTKPQKIILANNLGIIQDSITIKRHKHNDAWARIPNGSSNWRVYPHDLTNAPDATPGDTNSVYKKHFSGYMPSPIFSLERGFYTGSQQLSITAPGTVTPYDAEIWYTGSGPLAAYIGRDPSIFGNPYRQQFQGPPINIDSSIVIRAYVDTTDQLPITGLNNLVRLLPGFVETYTYIIDEAELPTNFSLPVVSIAYDSTSVGFYPGFGFNDPSTYMLSMEYFDKNKAFKFSSVGSGTTGSADNDLIPFTYAGFNFAANDEYGFNYTNKQQFYTDPNLGTSARTEQTNIQFKVAGDDSYPYQLAVNSLYSTHMRDAMSQTYAMKAGLNLDGSHYQPCIMYINGEYRGIFEIREAFDDEYTKHYYGVTGVQSLEKDGVLSSSPDNNAAEDWADMVSFITSPSNNMNNDSLLHLADSMLNFNSLIDLVIYNGYTVNANFPTKAAWWRYHDTLTSSIKWRYRMFDMDDTYGLGKNTAPLVSTYDASICQHRNEYYNVTDSSMAHMAIFNSLMVSDTFKAQFINRFSYLLNTSLKCEPIVAHLNYINNLLAPDMILHADTLGGNTFDTTFWNIAVDTMRAFIKARCGSLTEDIKTCYNVTGPFSFCTQIEPTPGGSVTLNTVNYPVDYSDSYFGNVYFNAIAVPSENYYFDHWEPTDFTLPSTSLTSDSIEWKFTAASCLKAVFRLKEAYNLTGEPTVPTGFSPNGDGNNDVLNVYGTLNVTEYHMEVYNRWGQKLYETNDKTKGWDGTFKGQEAPVGVYAYVFKATTTDGKQVQKSGNITLIR